MLLKSVLDNLVNGSNKQEFSKPEDKLAHLDARFREALCSLYRGEPQRGCDGELHAINPRIKVSLEEGLWLFEQCKALGAKDTLEIGFAYGFSTLYFLAAHHETGLGRHVAVDPYEDVEYNGIGRTIVRSLCDEASFSWMKDTSTAVALDLAARNVHFGLIFIDGSHTFEDALSDFSLYARLCEIGGYVVLDDMWMPSVKTVVSFIRANREDFSVLRSQDPNICVLRKKGEDKRKWDHFCPFLAASRTGFE
jgi:predicted O-methyltransferase YrrM